MGPTMQWREPPPDRTNRSTGETVRFGGRTDGGHGYLSHSERVGPGVLLLHEFFGLQSSFLAFADRLNEAGFTVLAPDLYDGGIATSVDEARSFAQSLDPAATLKKLHAAASFLTDNWHPRLGIVGFSLGADFAVALAAERPVEGLVLYYGLGDLDADADDWRVPTLGHFGDADDWVPLAPAEKAFAVLEDHGTGSEMHVYEGSGHWFANAAVPDAYRPAAADAAFERTADFLLHHLA
jgi:carboxymethylenebutenolidase